MLAHLGGRLKGCEREKARKVSTVSDGRRQSRHWGMMCSIGEGSGADCKDAAEDTVSEWLRRWTRNPLGSARKGSNPFGVDAQTLYVSRIMCM